MKPAEAGRGTGFVPLPGFGVVGRLGAHLAERSPWWRRKVRSRPFAWTVHERVSIRSLIFALRGHQFSTAGAALGEADRMGSTPAVSLGSASA